MLYKRFVILYALNIIGRMGNAVKIAAKADMVIIADEFLCRHCASLLQETALQR